AFSFAVAALIEGKVDAMWARWVRPWVLLAWSFLTIGIAMGSVWAYYELGWGGWWFWDPVENASFMPWLVGTALIHSLAVTEKRGLFKSWTLLLAIFTFSLSLLGTFLVRSGVLTSVHAFASDPERGFFILVLLAITVGGSLLLYAIRAYDVKSESDFELCSRETFLLINNVMLVVVCATVLLGTLYPLAIDALGMGKISVGPPFFNALFVPLMLLLSFMMALGISLRWKKSSPQTLVKHFQLPFVAAILAGVLSAYLFAKELAPTTSLALSIAYFIFFGSLKDVFVKVKHKADKWQGVRKLSRSYVAMHIAHAGVAVSLVGITMVSLYSEERDVRMVPGDSVSFSSYRFEFEGSEPFQGPNYKADIGLVKVYHHGEYLETMRPEKRQYPARGTVMTEADIRAGIFADVFVALGEPLSGGAWAVRLQYKPYMRWVWLGGLMMMFAGFLAALDPKYRRRKPVSVNQ
ncbi:MAG: heme lyase CcmF/NrfE family subunit, partial [Pseudomonadales bacterium]